MTLVDVRTHVRNLRMSPAVMAVGLIVVTLSLMLWHQFGMNRTFTVYPNPDIQVYALSDFPSGGASEVQSRVVDGALWVDCLIRNQYEWPFCQVDFNLGNSLLGGLDGQRYAQIRLDIDYVSPQPSDKLRVFIRSFEQNFSQPGQYNTLMPNQVEYAPARHDGAITLPLEQFVPAAWWLAEMDLPIHQQRPDFERIHLLQVSTGSIISEGSYQIRINEISLLGKWLSAATLYGFLLGLWILMALYWTTTQLLRLRKDLLAERRWRAGLEEINAVLELSNQQWEEQALHDELTGLRNRSGLRDHLYEAVQQAKAQNRPLSLIFIDIDHFKMINDDHGHILGDEVLCQFAAILRRSVREQDILVRWGGEEFLLLCPDTDLATAQAIAEDLRQVVEQGTWAHGERLASSFGVAQLEGEDARGLIVKADQALYRAKTQGRNRVAVSPVGHDDSAVERPAGAA